MGQVKAPTGQVPAGQVVVVVVEEEDAEGTHVLSKMCVVEW